MSRSKTRKKDVPGGKANEVDYTQGEVTDNGFLDHDMIVKATDNISKSKCFFGSASTNNAIFTVYEGELVFGIRGPFRKASQQGKLLVSVLNGMFTKDSSLEEIEDSIEIYGLANMEAPYLGKPTMGDCSYQLGGRASFMRRKGGRFGDMMMWAIPPLEEIKRKLSENPHYRITLELVPVDKKLSKMSMRLLKEVAYRSMVDSSHLSTSLTLKNQIPREAEDLALKQVDSFFENGLLFMEMCFAHGVAMPNRLHLTDSDYDIQKRSEMALAHAQDTENRNAFMELMYSALGLGSESRKKRVEFKTNIKPRVTGTGDGVEMTLRDAAISMMFPSKQANYFRFTRGSDQTPDKLDNLQKRAVPDVIKSAEGLNRKILNRVVLKIVADNPLDMADGLFSPYTR